MNPATGNRMDSNQPNSRKHKLIAEIQNYLTEELKDADEDRTREIQAQLLMYRFLPIREYGPEDVIIPSTLVELELESTQALYFVTPRGGGLITNIDGRPVQVITPNSPLGEALMGKKIGDEVKVETRGTTRTYKVISIL